MSVQTTSEKLFEEICIATKTKCVRIPEGKAKSADYRIYLGEQSIVVEVKQLEKNKNDHVVDQQTPNIDDEELKGLPAMAPRRRVRGLINDAYPQIKASTETEEPAIIALYNNSYFFNYIDAWTVSSAMFGDYGFVLSHNANDLGVVRQGYLGNRKATKQSMTRISAVAVINQTGECRHEMELYHNPYCKYPIAPEIARSFASKQHVFENPHAKGYSEWCPKTEII